ncbi:MAG TPA: LacI family DNA-binding transcriptional regulator [Acidobacteriaceae bacterium]|nr:LacI family DNA-binding transcriptional regulator [Acidobacteriaceae bacterium]
MKAPNPAGIKEVASRAGVGIGSVSRVFSGQPGVSPEMRLRVHKAAKSLGYSPNLLAQALRRKQTRSVGFVVSDIANPLLSSMVHGAEAVLSRAGYSLLLTNSGGRPSVDTERIRLLRQRQVDGLIILPAVEDNPEMLAALSNSTIPIVVIDRSLPSEIGARYVLSDHYAGVGDATARLLELGHRSMGVVVGPDVRPSRERIRAVADAYAARGIRQRFVVDRGSLSAEHGALAMTTLLDAADPPTAVILGGNQLLEGALAVIRARGLCLGSDLSLVCCDDVPLGRLFETPISIVMRDTALMGQSAARLLLEAITEPRHEPATAVLPTWFESRASCGRPKRKR